MANHINVGNWGERIAMEYLLRQGYIIREQNWRLNKLEVDIIAEYNNRIIVVEVKTRTTDFVDPLRAVDKRKQRYLINAGRGYLEYYNISRELQFDVITIIGTPEKYEIEHIPDAFLPKLKTY